MALLSTLNTFELVQTLKYFLLKVLKIMYPLQMSFELMPTVFTTLHLRIGNGDGNEIERYSVIELSSKVLDSPDRLRDTMVHEMCHGK